ncbi:uncharacterized protein LOC129220091 [Uloborus diversus]|uniref:uncharacterized protein LOC129220091 n=1 Tax=Uloborus diversus TaxID=327109 RepID=UPI0024097623|nr:uncharacterized protein LOC129220091 [Uloborus diversus]
MFCKDKIPKCEERRHLEVCAFKEHDKSHKIAPANDEWEKRDGKNSGAVSKYSKFSNKVESSLKKCIYCDVYFDAILDPKHMDECIPNLGQCTLCYTVVTIGNFKKHLENDCLKNKDDEKWSKAGSKKKGKNKSNMSSSAPPKGSNIWNFFKKFTADYGMSSGYDATVENTGIYEADRDFSLVYEKSASEIKLPCEFCEELFSMVSLVEHQSGCRPDLVHFPPNHDRQDVRKASDLLATNFLDENSFPADKEFTLPEMKRKLNRNLFSRFETDAAPGSFLEEYNTFEEKNHQYSGKEEYEFNYVANLSSKNSNMKNNTNAVETLPTKNTSISSKNLEIHKPEFSSSLPIPHATGSNFKIEHITEKESHFSLGDCKNDENENIKIKTFSNQNKVIDSDSSDESIDDVKSKKFSSRSEIIDLSSSDENIAEDVKSKKNSNKNETTNLSSSDESIDGENIDAYITYLSKKHEIPDMNDDEIKRDIYHLEESLSAPHKSELVSK